jgi:hypothetical protein
VLSETVLWLRLFLEQWGTPFSGKFRSTEIERELGDSGTWVILIIARSILLESFRAFGGHLHQGLEPVRVSVI